MRLNCFGKNSISEVRFYITSLRKLPMQYTEIFFSCKNWKILSENFRSFSYFCSKRRFWVPQSMFWSINKKNRYTPANPILTI